MAAEEPVGLIVVDKPAGMTSHDVVSRIRRLARTRRVGHGGTLDPMATGVLVIGVGKATRLLTYVIGSGKRYSATIRLGESTVTDDAEGDIVASKPTDGIDESAIRAGLALQTGTIQQVPSAVSAIKIDGKRAYKMIREGETVDLPARTVVVSTLDVLDIRPATSAASGAAVIDVDVDVACSSGTYIRAIARDLGAHLGTGGHLTALSRTAVGGFTLDVARTLDQLAEQAGRDDSTAADLMSLTLDEAASQFFRRRDADPHEARVLSHGGPLSPIGAAEPYAVFAPSGEVIAIVQERDGKARAEVVFAPA